MFKTSVSSQWVKEDIENLKRNNLINRIDVISVMIVVYILNYVSESLFKRKILLWRCSLLKKCYVVNFYFQFN